MEAALADDLPADVLIVEDDLIIALDLEETILRLGVKTCARQGVSPERSS